jgi:lipid-A-disaccharide synthase
MLSCGEPSGDVYAGALAEALRAREPGIELFGLGGPRAAAAGVELVGDFSALSVTGLTGALRVVPRSIGLIRRLAAAARARRPDVMVVIDAPDFNFPLMWALRRSGIPVVYYVSPQLWAWRGGRMATMKARVERVLVIFPFEEALYRNAGVAVQCVGHPLVDMAKASQARAAFLSELGLAPDRPTVALLPGSRRNELHRIAPPMAGALPLIRAAVPDVQFVIAGAPNLSDDVFEPLLADGPPEGPHEGNGPPEGGPHIRGGGHPVDVGAAFRRPVLVRGRMDDVLNACDIAITASGTATIQCALHERPMVVVYRVSWLDYQMAKRFVRLDSVAMPNVLAGRRIVPELLQDDLTAGRVADATVRLLTDRDAQSRTRDELRRVRALLGAPGATGRAADAVLEVARGRHT